jgi:hypothetical protein
LPFGGLAVTGPSARLELVSTSLRGIGGDGIQVYGGAELVADAIVIQGVEGTGVDLLDPGSRAAIEGLWAADTGTTIHLGRGTATTLARAHFVGAGGVFLDDGEDATTTATISDLLVEDPERSTRGAGVVIIGGRSTIERASIAASSGPGVVASGRVTVRDLTTTDTGLGLMDQGPGLLIGGIVTADRVRIDQARNVGLWIYRGATATLRDVSIAGTYSHPVAGGYVNHINISDDSVVDLERVAIVGTQTSGGLGVQRSQVDAPDLDFRGCTTGVVVEIEPAPVTIEDLRVEGGGDHLLLVRDSGSLTIRRAELDAAVGASGHGILVESLGVLSLESFVVRGPTIGFELGPLGHAMLRDGEIGARDRGVVLSGAHDGGLFSILDRVRLSGATSVTSSGPP